MRVLKWFLKMIVKIILFPVVFVLMMLNFVIKAVTYVYGFVATFFWYFVLFGIVWTVMHQQWNQTIIFVVLGTITFLMLFLAVWIQIVLEDMLLLIREI